MLVMAQMRRNTKIIMIATALAFAALMLFEWGMDASGRSGGGGEIGVVNGESVRSDQYNLVYQNLYSQAQDQQEPPLTSLQIKELEDQAFNEIVTQILIEQELENVLGHDRPVATLLTQVLVDAADPAFEAPTKFVGPVYDKPEADRVAKARGWQMAQDGDKWRRVVPSPAPQDIPDLRVIRLLADGGAIVICAGGGGIPVIRRDDGSLIGVEAVVDKDAASALLADRLNADALLLLTDVDGIQRDFGTDDARRIDRMTPGQAREMDLPAGSMAPKARAAARFAAGGGDRMAAIGRLADAVALLDGQAGTVIAPG